LDFIKFSQSVSHVKWLKETSILGTILSSSLGTDVTGHLEFAIYIPAQSLYSWLGGVKDLLYLALVFHRVSLDWLRILVTGYHAWLKVKYLNTNSGQVYV
jgi:hypothetical protein